MATLQVVDRDGVEHAVEAKPGLKVMEVLRELDYGVAAICGGMCSCATCHIYVEKGMDQLSEPTEAEDDRVEEAPGLQRNSRLSCQCTIEGKGPIVVRIPSWNRNAVKEAPH